jgi:hypothetical protein
MTTTHPANQGRKEAIDREPFEVVVDLLCEVERSLPRDRVGEVAARVVRGRAAHRRIALELLRNPQVLRTGLSPCAVMVGDLLLALKKAGAVQLAAPRCRFCGREVPYVNKRARDWGCGRCLRKPEECARCGNVRAVGALDRHGRPHCERCPLQDGDSTEALLKVLAELEPALGKDKVVAALQQAAKLASGRRRIAWAIVDHPELLAGQGASAPVPGVLRFIDALHQAGAGAVILPCCPRCGQLRKLRGTADGRRVCGPCGVKARTAVCRRCGGTKPKNHRDDDGNPLCQSCWASDPRSWEVCVSCGNRRRVAGRTAAGPSCQTCRPRPERVCGICGRTGRGGLSRAIGKPVCDLCEGHWIVCCCGTGAVIRGGTLKEPLCAHCVNPDPNFWKRCRVCRTTWQLTTSPCTRCCLDHRLRKIFTGADGTTPAELDRLRETLVRVDRPVYAITWLRKANVRDTIQAVVREHRVITHGALDAIAGHQDAPASALDAGQGGGIGIARRAARASGTPCAGRPGPIRGG